MSRLAISSSSRRRQSNVRKRSSNKSLTVIALIGFGFVWAAALLVSHVSLSSLPSAGGGDGHSVDSTVTRLDSNSRLEQKQIQQKESPTKKDDPNPYFGWQPRIATEMACSWRDCFAKQIFCATCRDLPQEMGQAPSLDGLPKNANGVWIPDVTLLHRMRLAGVDAQGNPWPPPLGKELCEPIGVVGGKRDINKERECMVGSFVSFSLDCCLGHTTREGVPQSPFGREFWT